MGKFKVGDKVRTSIKLADERGDRFGITLECHWKDEFVRTVMNVSERAGCTTVYILSEDRLRLSWPEYALVSAEPREFIVIRRDDREVIASHKRGDEIVKTAKATCAPSDEFNFETGAKLAFDRLMGREEPKPIPQAAKMNADYWINRAIKECAEESGKRIRDYVRKGFNATPTSTSEPAPQPAPRFKVGDRVVHKSVPEVGTVERVQEHSFMGVNWIYVKYGIDIRVCHPDNLSPAPEPKYYSGKVFAVRTKDDDATPRMQNRVGHVFEIKDGRFVGNVDEFLVEMDDPIWSFDHFCKFRSATEWQEVKE